MSTISGVSSAGDAWANMKAQRSQMQAKMFTKVDTDSSGGVDKTELQGLLDDVAKKTGVTSGSSTDELFSKMDSNSDGSLSSDELGQGMQSIMPPPPSTMDFAKVRSDSSSASGGDDLFGKVDTDGNGSVSKEEMKSLMKLMDKLASDSGSGSTSSSSSSSDVFSKLDTDSDGSLSKAEFEAGRTQGGKGPQGAGAMPPPPPPGGAGGSGSASSGTTYDPLDTNEDGVVSAQERLAGSSSTDPLQALFKAIDTNSDSKISASESDTFVKQLTSQVQAMTQSAQNTDTSTSSQGKQEGFDLAQLARRAYDQIASGLAQQTKSSALSAMA